MSVLSSDDRGAVRLKVQQFCGPYCNTLTTSLRHPFYGINLARRILAHDRRSWFYFAILYLHSQHCQRIAPPVNYYEFGVGWGETLSLFLTALRQASRTAGLKIDESEIFLFDSFEGLPEPKFERDKNSAYWKKRDFANSIEHIKNVVAKKRIDSSAMHFVKGYFEPSLTDKLRNQLMSSPPGIITVDCDYYSSTKTVLEWLGPLLSTGTLFYFDDIWNFGGNPHYGENGAINEFNAEHKYGFLTPLTLFPLDGPSGRVFIYSKNEYEYV